MIVDCHTHINQPASNVAVADYLEACEKVDNCIALAAGDGDNGRVNEDLSQYVKSHPKVIGFAAINPTENKVSEKNIRSITKSLNLAGLVLYCAENKFHPAHSRAMRLYESAESLNLPVFFHNCPPFGKEAILDYARPFLLDEPARKFGSLKIIIGGMGVPFIAQTLSMLAKHENVYADLAISPDNVWQVYNIVVSANEAGVMDKLLFGSGYPVARADSCIETLLGFNKLLTNTNLPTVPREKIRHIIERDSLSLLGIQTDYRSV